jgi:putative alpha-1,2-mannosidase
MYNAGKSFVIKARNNSDENIYIQSATLNGKTLDIPKLKFRDVVAGGILELEMGSVPNKKWGNK